jgi:bleomycin hydrolase
MKKFLLLSAFCVLAASVTSAQVLTTDKGSFKEKKASYYDEIEKEANSFKAKPAKEKKSFKVDFTGINVPKSNSEFKTYWHTDPISQGVTGTCWSFSTCSYFESEIYRLHKREIRLSPIYIAYWEYVEKVKRYVQERGESVFGEGSEGNAVKRIMKQYGAVPFDAYSGLKPGQKFHDHSAMFAEMDTYLENVKKSAAWDEAEVVANIKAIMNHYLLPPPEKFTYNGKEYTPAEFFKKEVDLNMDDYIDVLSLKQQPYFKHVVYPVPDNWWFDSSYVNVPLDEFMKIIKSAVRNGYTVVIGGDVSEAGLDSYSKAAIVPTFDIPKEYINEDARQFRFSNETTTDDHGIHIVGYTEKDGLDWFLIKDSGSGSRNIGQLGYLYFREDYVKLKIMDFMVHKDALGNLLSKVN